MRTQAVLLTGLLAVLPIVAAAQDEASHPVPSDKLATAPAAMGHTPLWVYQHFGRPVFSTTEGSCCVFSGYSSYSNHGAVLVHAYNLTVGGRLAFLYDRLPGSEQWVVVGVVYDALQSDDHQSLAAFFPGGTPIEKRLFRCYEDQDWYHTPAGAPHAVSALYAAWHTTSDTILYAKYIAGELPTVYDPVAGHDILKMPNDFSNRTLVQFGLFEPLNKVMDLHFAEDDDFSIVTSYVPCVKN
jgi:hypothetical protein